MPDNKNTFDFGTGSIDRDQWLRDIDSGLEEFISMYGNVANKHRTTLLRQAFQDLRRRIANGDMLNRTADGLYQFGSALNRKDKHMLEAYQRALGFMGNLARTQIKAPTPLEEKKYGTSTLLLNWLKYLNPSGEFNSKSYWEGDDASRIAELKNFLKREKDGLGVYTGYEGYKDRADLESRIDAFISDPTEKNLQRLGFKGLNWITKPTEETSDSEQKSELQQAQERYNAALEQLQTTELNLKILDLNAPNPVRSTLFTFNPSNFYTYSTYERNLDNIVNNLRGTDANGKYFLKANSIMSRVPKGDGRTFSYTKTTVPTSWNGDAAKQAIIYAQLEYNRNYHNELDNFFKNLGINYLSYLNNPTTLQANLAKLFATTPEGKFISHNTINKYFIQNLDGTYGLRGTTLSYAPGIDLGTLYLTSNIDNYKEGGVIKGEDGLIFDYSKYLEKPKVSQKNNNSTLDNSLFSNSENARIAAIIADIASMGAAFVPGYGTAASAVLGLGSTATNFGADLADGQGLWNATKNAGFGLAADVMGLIPGLGGVGKGAKIARNLMWAVPKMMLWVNTANGLANAKEIKNSIVKLTSPSSMSVQDWLNVSQALQIMTGHGRSAATKIKKAGMTKEISSTTEPEYYIFTNKGKQKVSDETFKKLRETRGTKARQDLTLKLMGDGITLQQTRFAPWNTSTRFGAFKEVPSRTKIKIQDKHKGWFSDENLVEGTENLNPSVDIRNFLYKMNPYRGYYQGRTQNFGPLPLYLERPVQVLPNDFGITKEGMKTAGFSMEKPKRKPLSAELKLKKAANRAKKKQETEEKLKLLKTNLLMSSRAAMSEEVPSTDMNHSVNVALALKKQLDLQRLSSPYATRPEIPDNFAPQVATFYDRYGRFPIRHKFGGILKALRNGGIIKAVKGVKLSSNAGSWYDDVFSGYGDAIINRLKSLEGNGRLAAVDWLNGMLEAHSLMYTKARNNFNAQASGDATINAYQVAYNQGNGFTTEPGGFNTLGIQPHYNTRYDFEGIPRNTGDNATQDWGPDGYYSLITDDRRILGRLKDWSPELLNAFNAKLKDLGYVMDNNYEDKYYRIKPLDGTNAGSSTNPNDTTLKDLQKTNKNNSSVDSLTGIGTVVNKDFKDPWDPTLLITAGKTALGLLGNRNIYGNLLDEMPQAPLRDPIDRKLAIVGWQEKIKQGLNELADLRRVQQRLQGADQQTNFATALETERVGRDIMDKAFMEDSGRLFETAGKSWNLDNEDTLYNAKVGDDNRKSIADRARMMAQIRAAWRSGDNNTLMGALSDTGNWWLKKYQREQDIVNLAREQSLGTKEEFLNNYMIKLHPDYDALKAEYDDPKTSVERKKAIAKTILEYKVEALRKVPAAWAGKVYDTFHNPMFGVGYNYSLVGKDGTKLEVAKPRARSKDNDRYVSIVKDLRKHRRR